MEYRASDIPWHTKEADRRLRSGTWSARAASVLILLRIQPRRSPAKVLRSLLATRTLTHEIDTENEKIVYLRRIKRNQARYTTEKNRACFAIETKIIRIHVGRFIRVLMVVSLGTAGSRYPRATMIPSW